MIEKFSKEEINQLLRELGLSQKTTVPRKSIALAEEKVRIAKIIAKPQNEIRIRLGGIKTKSNIARAISTRIIPNR